MAEAPDLSVPRRVHVVAAGGAGMSAIATVLAQSGHTVTGSDAADGAALRRLEDLGVRVQVGHSAAAVDGADLGAPSIGGLLGGSLLSRGQQPRVGSAGGRCCRSGRGGAEPG